MAAPFAAGRSARGPSWRLWLAFAASRLGILIVTLGWFPGDTETYFRHGRSWIEGHIPYLDHAIEYPPGATLLFAALAGIGSSYAQFRVVFAVACLLVDATLTRIIVRMLARLAPPDRRAVELASLTYLLATGLLYPVLLVRFDLFPAAAVLAATELLAAPGELTRARAAAAGAWLGLGVALKLYPLLFFPLLLLAAWRRALRPSALLVLTATAAAFAAVTFVPFLAAGAGRAVLSFLHYQGERGLQIESTWASALLLLATFLPLDVHQAASHHAHDVVGPAASALTRVARIAQPLALLAVTAVVDRRRLPLPRAFAALVATALATASVLSPQFLLWLVPLVAVGLGTMSRGTFRWAVGLTVAIALTSTLVFPWLYDALIAERVIAIIPLALRNSMLCALVVVLCRPNIAPSRGP